MHGRTTIRHNASTHMHTIFLELEILYDLRPEQPRQVRRTGEQQSHTTHLHTCIPYFSSSRSCMICGLSSLARYDARENNNPTQRIYTHAYHISRARDLV